VKKTQEIVCSSESFTGATRVAQDWEKSLRPMDVSKPLFSCPLARKDP